MLPNKDYFDSYPYKLKRKAEKLKPFSKYKNDENTSLIFKSKYTRTEFVVPVCKKYGTLETFA